MIILLYSNQDINFNNRLRSIKGNYELMKLVNLVSIDDADIYNIIKTSTNMSVKEVPCILDIDGENISMFEGFEKTNEYIDELIEHINAKKETKNTDLSELGFVTEEVEEPIQATVVKKSLKEMVADMTSQRDNFSVTSTASENLQGRSPIHITSSKQTNP
jgi:hypothetical protein